MYKLKLARDKPDIEPHMADQFQSHVVLVEDLCSLQSGIQRTAALVFFFYGKKLGSDSV